MLPAMNAYDFTGKTVLITGASMGIGAEFARELSRRGAIPILVARGEAKLEALREELGNAHVIKADLTAPGAAQKLLEAVTEKGLEVDVLINNAGFGIHGSFKALTLAEQREIIDLNVTALYELTYLFLPMIERRKGGFIQLASVAGYQPIPYMAVYAATKAFVLSFSEALWAELRERGVRVLCLSPGATETAFFERSGPGADPGKKARPQDVVQLGLAAFSKGRASVVHGGGNKFLTFSSRFFGREFIAKLGEKMTRPKTPVRLPTETSSQHT